MLNISIGASVSSVEYMVLEHSIRQRSSIPVDVKSQLLPWATPKQWNYQGVSVFLDASLLCLQDIERLYASFDPAYAVQLSNDQRALMFNNELCQHYRSLIDVPDSLIGHLPDFFISTSSDLPEWQAELQAIESTITNQDIGILTPQLYGSLTWTFANRYQLTSDHPTANYCNDELKKQVKIADPNLFSYSDMKVAICEAVRTASHVEVRVSDFLVPSGHVTPIEFFKTSRPWTVVLWALDPYAGKTRYPAFTTSSYVAAQYSDKDTQYIPKTFAIDHIELGWIAFDVIDDVIFLHHNQIPGALKGILTSNEELWMYRYMLRTFCQAISGNYKAIFMPNASTYNMFMNAAQKHTSLPFTPFSRHVARSSGFVPATWTEFVEACPSADAQCIVPDYVDLFNISLWRYHTINYAG